MFRILRLLEGADSRRLLPLAALVMLPAFFLGFFGDDFFHLILIEGKQATAVPLAPYCFAPGNAEAMSANLRSGPFPWFVDLEAKAKFFRPLSVLLMRLDRALFGQFFPAFQAHSLLWYLLLCLGASLVFRRVLPPAACALALAVFLVDDAHFFPAAWWSNRNAVVACAPAVLGLAAHLRWRETGWRAGLPLSLLGYGVGLLGAEAAVGILAYVVAYEAFGAEDGRIRRALSLAPAASLALGYFLWYRAAGYGAAHSDMYIDPGAAPLKYLAAAPLRFLQLAGGQFLSIPCEAETLIPGLAPAVALMGAGALALVLLLVAVFWRRMDPRERRALRWMGPGTAMAAAPALSAIMTSRLLLAVSLGGAVILAVVLRHAALAALDADTRTKRRAASAVAGLLFFLHLVFAPLSWPVQTAGLRAVGAHLNRGILRNPLDHTDITPRQVIVPCVPDPYTGIYPPIIRAHAGLPLARSWWTLSFAPYDHRLSRTGEKTMELEVLGGQMLEGAFERLLSAAENPLRPGDTRDLDGLVVTVLATGDRGPVRIRLDFAEAPEAERYLFLMRKNGQFEPFAPPAVGESLLLPFSLRS